MMSMTNAARERLGWMAAAVVTVALFFAFAAWAGIPAGTSEASFWAMIAILLVFCGAFVLLAWHLSARSMAAGLRAPAQDHLSLRQRQTLAIVLTGGAICLAIGAFWDELWHRLYGIPFGEDFFWRPHLLMYVSFSATIFSGFWALHYLNRRLRGNFQQRFRANPVIGWLIFSAAFLLYALTSDPVWHSIYGDDLSAWSVPHLLLLAGYAMTILVAVYLHVSTIKTAAWRGLLDFRQHDLLPIGAFAALLLVWLQVMLIDWDQILMGITAEQLGLYRPNWMLAPNLLAPLILVGVLANRVMRRAGAGTMIGLLALALRYLCIQFFGAEQMQYVGWAAALVPLAVIDIYCHIRIGVQGRGIDWRALALAATIAMLLDLPLLRAFYGIALADIAVYIVPVALTAIGMSWLTHQIGDRLEAMRGAEAAVQARRVVYPPLLLGGSVLACALVVIVFVTTASPPI